MRKISLIALSAAFSLLLCACSPSEQNGGNQGSQNSDNVAAAYWLPQSSDSLDEVLECESIILQKADALKKMVGDYYNPDSSALAFSLGNLNKEESMDLGREVASSRFSTYDEFKGMFSEDIYGEYIDYINGVGNGFRESEGKLYYTDYPTGSVRGSLDTWYLGYDIEGGRIIGHFAELKWDVGSDEQPAAEYLNDESNYYFYDLVVQKIEGKYLVTNCVSAEGEQRYLAHGTRYNSGAVDKTLITNPNLIPKG